MHSFSSDQSGSLNGSLSGSSSGSLSEIAGHQARTLLHNRTTNRNQENEEKLSLRKPFDIRLVSIVFVCHVSPTSSSVLSSAFASVRHVI